MSSDARSRPAADATSVRACASRHGGPLSNAGNTMTTSSLRTLPAPDGTLLRWNPDAAEHNAEYYCAESAAWLNVDHHYLLDHHDRFSVLRAAPYAPAVNPVRDAILAALMRASRSHAPWDLPARADALATTLRPLVLKAATVGELAEELRARDEVTHYSHISDSCLRWPGLRRVLVLPTATTETQ